MNKVSIELLGCTVNLPIRKASPKYQHNDFGDNFTSFEETNCWCNSRFSDSLPILKNDRFGLPLNFVICKTCGTIRIKNYPQKNEVNSFYTNSYRQLYFGMASPSTLHIYDEQRSRARRFLRILKSKDIDVTNKSVLEIGCGAGGLLSVFGENGANCIGIEPHKEYSRYCREEFKIPCFTGTYQEAYTQKDMQKKFDIIIISHVLEHLLDVREDLKEILSLYAKNDTILFLEVPSIERMGATSRFIDYFHIAHPWSFNIRSLKSLISTLPLEIVYIDNVISCICRYNKVLNNQSIDKNSNGYPYTLLLLFGAIARDNLRILNLFDRLLYRLKRIKDLALNVFN